MAINKDSNGYTITYAIVLVVVVGAILASVSMGLKPIQEKNQAKKKKMDILGAIKIESTRQSAEEDFTKYIKEGYVLKSDGSVKEGSNLKEAEKLDIQKQYRNKNIQPAEREFPLFIADKDGETLYIIPMVGSGLWGPIWGYVSVKADMTTIAGAKFDHKTETPGLGAEIKVYKAFQQQFEDDKAISNNGEFVKMQVTKGIGAKGNSNMVDGITGGTITSKGVEKMLNETLVTYVNYFKTKTN